MEKRGKKKNRKKFVEPEMHWAILGILGYHQFTAKETMEYFLSKSD